MPQQSSVNSYTGLILLSGIDRPRIAEALFSTLSAFVIKILDIEQVVIRDRLILTVLVCLDPSHAAALEADLNQCAADVGMDIAVSFADQGLTAMQKKGGLLHLIALGEPLLPGALATITAKLAEYGANIERINRVASSPVTAIEFVISGVTHREIQGALVKISSINGIDIAVQPRGLLRFAKRLVVMDVDSTLFQQEVIDLLAAKAGVLDQVAAITASSMRGEIDFEESLRERVSLLKGLPVSILDEVREAILLTAGADTLIKTLHHLGHTVGAVSGGFIEVIEPILRKLGIDYYRANSLGIEAGSLTGTVVGLVIDRVGKADALRDFASQANVPLEATVAIGDGANDLDMISEAGMGIAFNAKPTVRGAAGSALTQPYLDSVLLLMGITPEDIEATNI
jgi:phosphoserine phosphatase